MLRQQGAKLVVTSDTPTDFLVASAKKTDRAGRPLFLAGVQIRKNYVSYHLMPVYGIPSLLDGLSPALRKRMQGKGCFNFTSVDEPLLAELEELVVRAFEAFQKLPYMK